METAAGVRERPQDGRLDDEAVEAAEPVVVVVEAVAVSVVSSADTLAVAAKAKQQRSVAQSSAICQYK